MLQAGIEFQNNVTTMLYDVMDAVNLSTASIYGMQHALDRVTVTINQAATALQGLTRAAGVTPAPSPDPPQAAWQTDNQRVFTSTGEDRFRLETADLNRMLEQLSSTQDALAKQAFRDITFPPEAFQNLNSLAARISIMRERVQQIEDNPLNFGTDTANMELERLRGQLSLALQQQNRLNEAMDSADVSAANAAYLGLSRTIGNTERYVRDSADGQGEFNCEMDQGSSRANGILKALKGVVSKYATMENLSAVMDLSDQMMSATARLDMMNDGQQSTKDLQGMIFDSAERSGSSYQGTMAAVSDLGISAGGAFSGNEEIVAFMEQVNKQLAISGTGEGGSAAVLSQITQTMGSGVLEEGGFDTILSQAPGMIQTIADYMDLPREQLKGLATEGKITADIVKSAMFAATDETNTKFESMPMTFAQMQTSFQNHAQMAFQPVLERINEIANSAEFQEFVNGIVTGFYMVSEVVLWIMDLMAAAGTFISDNWSVISPIIFGVVAALGFYLIMAGIVAIINAVVAVSERIKAAAQRMSTNATREETASQYGLNAALAACPLVWIIMLIIVLIAIFYAAVAAVNHFAGTSISATGIICGIFAVAGAFIGNLIIGMINFVIGVFCLFWNFIAKFANFFGNVFSDPVNSIARLFFDMADFVLQILETLASAIDTVFGSNLSGTVSGWRGSLESWVDKEFGKGKEIMQEMNAEDYYLDRLEYGDAWDEGYNFGQGVEDTVSDLFNFEDKLPGQDNLPQDIPPYGGDTGGGLGGGLGDGVADGLDSSGTTGNLDAISANTEDMAESMSITQEDLKYLRDIAEQETVNRFTTAQISIDQSGMKNTVNGTNDLDGFVSKLTSAVDEAVTAITEGVHN